MIGKPLPFTYICITSYTTKQVHVLELIKISKCNSHMNAITSEKFPTIFTTHLFNTHQHLSKNQFYEQPNLLAKQTTKTRMWSRKNHGGEIG